MAQRTDSQHEQRIFEPLFPQSLRYFYLFLQFLKFRACQACN